MDILGTYPESKYKSNYNLKLFIILAIIFISISLFVALVYLNDGSYEKAFYEIGNYIGVIVIYPLLMAAIYSIFARINVYFKTNKILKKKYNNAYFKFKYQKRIEEREGLLYKRVRLYQIVVKDYLCKVQNYQLYKRVFDFNYRRHFSTHRNYRYQIVENNWCYEYDLGKNTNLYLEINCDSGNFDSYQISEILKNNLKELSKSRLLHVIIDDNKVKIIKKIKVDELLNQRTTKEIISDLDDIKIFYEKIVEGLKKIISYIILTIF